MNFPNWDRWTIYFQNYTQCPFFTSNVLKSCGYEHQFFCVRVDNEGNEQPWAKIGIALFLTYGKYSPSPTSVSLLYIPQVIGPQPNTMKMEKTALRLALQENETLTSQKKPASLGSHTTQGFSFTVKRQSKMDELYTTLTFFNHHEDIHFFRILYKNLCPV